MTHCIEPLVHDLVWEWLDRRDRYESVAGEVTVGSGVNSGRIDIVGETTDGEYHGFEIKDTGLSAEQLNRYVKSGFFDAVYHCSRVGHEIAATTENEATNRGANLTLRDVRTQLSNGIAAGQYTEREVVEAVRETVGERAWRGELRGFGQVNDRLLDDEEKTVEAFFTSNLGIPTADFDPDETYVDLDTATERLENEVGVPNEVGVVHVPVPLDDDQIDEDAGEPDPNEDWRATLDDPVSDVFTAANATTVEVVREATPLARESSPSLSRTNEAWVQHHAWRAYGTIREAVVPCPDDDRIRRVDVMRFEGADTATGVYDSPANAEVVGVEAKGASAVGGEAANESVREQLRSYLDSGCLTRLYLAVPDGTRSAAQTLLESGDGTVADVGLITVDDAGELTVVERAAKRRQRFDAYVKAKGSKEYLRSVGYGRVKPLEETEPNSPCRVATR